MSNKKKNKRVQELTDCLIHIQENLHLMYQERLPLEVKIGVESLFFDIKKVLEKTE